mmetsp:Transcript_23976/g.72184  ORF Transcript_23976/g.72184 Transcript_23976/m.72184 type:complete len:261 (+) Transcript_23976:630-1412(+)
MRVARLAVRPQVHHASAPRHQLAREAIAVAVRVMKFRAHEADRRVRSRGERVEGVRLSDEVAFVAATTQRRTAPLVAAGRASGLGRLQRSTLPLGRRRAVGIAPDVDQRGDAAVAERSQQRLFFEERVADRVDRWARVSRGRRRAALRDAGEQNAPAVHVLAHDRQRHRDAANRAWRPAWLGALPAFCGRRGFRRSAAAAAAFQEAIHATPDHKSASPCARAAGCAQGFELQQREALGFSQTSHRRRSEKRGVLAAKHAT